MASGSEITSEHAAGRWGPACRGLGNLMKLKIAAAFAALSMLSVAGAAQAGVIYDNFTSEDASVDIGGHGYTAVFQSDIDQTINQIGARLRGGEADVKFVIIDLGNGANPTNTGQTLFSDVTHITADQTFDWEYSDLFSFALSAGRWYAVGAVAAPGSALFTSYDYAGAVNPGPTFTAFANNNVNIFSFDNPNDNYGFGCCNIHVQLLSGGATGAVPEPAAWALMILGFGSAGVMLRRTRLAQA